MATDPLRILSVAGRLLARGDGERAGWRTPGAVWTSYIERRPGDAAPSSAGAGLANASLERVARVLFFVCCALVLMLGSAVAWQMTTAGAWSDSPNNLDTARNLALGRGFVSNMVLQLAVPMPVPVPEAVRPPGIPWIYGTLFALLGGLDTRAAVVLNTLVVVAGAFVVRAVIRRAGGTWFADLAGALFVISHNTYVIVSTVNNAWLVLCIGLALLLLVSNETGGLRGWRLALVAGALAAAGFLLKQTMMLGLVPFGVAVVLTDGTRPARARLREATLVVGVFLLFTSPYWLYNVVRHGEPLYYPYSAYRLYMRYQLVPTGELWRTVMFDAPALTYSELARQLGWRRIIATDLSHSLFAIMSIAKFNPIVFLAAAASPFFADPKGRRHLLLTLFLTLPVAADIGLALPEQRYAWPLWPLMLYAAWLSVRGVAVHLQARARPLSLAVHRVAAVIAFAIAIPLAVREWRRDAIEALTRPPAFAAAARSIPEGAVIFGVHPWSMAFFLDRTVVLYPVGGREAMTRVNAHYRPTHLLLADMFGRSHDFRPDELQLVDKGAGWSLFRILRPGQS